MLINVIIEKMIATDKVAGYESESILIIQAGWLVQVDKSTQRSHWILAIVPTVSLDDKCLV